MEQSAARHEEIARLAFHIYEQEGRAEGKSGEHWARAERCLREQRVSLPSNPPKSETTEHLP